MTVSVWSGCHCPLDLSRSLPPTCLFARLHASRIMCGPHASRNVWPTCKPAASNLARVGARAHTCACAACSPELGRGMCPFRLPAAGVSWSGTLRAFPACPPACSPSRLSLMSRVVRLVAPPANRLSSSRRYARLVAGTPPKRAIKPAPALPLVAAFPL